MTKILIKGHVIDIGRVYFVDPYTNLTRDIYSSMKFLDSLALDEYLRFLSLGTLDKLSRSNIVIINKFLETLVKLTSLQREVNFHGSTMCDVIDMIDELGLRLKRTDECTASLENPLILKTDYTPLNELSSNIPFSKINSIKISGNVNLSKLNFLKIQYSLIRYDGHINNNGVELKVELILSPKAIKRKKIDIQMLENAISLGTRVNSSYSNIK